MENLEDLTSASLEDFEDIGFPATTTTRAPRGGVGGGVGGGGSPEGDAFGRAAASQSPTDSLHTPTHDQVSTELDETRFIFETSTEDEVDSTAGLLYEKIQTRSTSTTALSAVGKLWRRVMYGPKALLKSGNVGCGKYNV